MTKAIKTNTAKTLHMKLELGYYYLLGYRYVIKLHGEFFVAHADRKDTIFEKLKFTSLPNGMASQSILDIIRSVDTMLAYNLENSEGLS